MLQLYEKGTPVHAFFKKFAQVLTNLQFNQFKQLSSRPEPPIHRFYFGTLLNFNLKQVPIIPNTEHQIFQSVFSRICTEYGEIGEIRILRISPHLVQMRENTDQKKLLIRTAFTQLKLTKRYLNSDYRKVKIFFSFPQTFIISCSALCDVKKKTEKDLQCK